MGFRDPALSPEQGLTKLPCLSVPEYVTEADDYRKGRGGAGRRETLVGMRGGVGGVLGATCTVTKVEQGVRW